MALDQHASSLITTTVNAFNGEVASISPFDGISLIDSWLSFLRGNGQADSPVVNGLSDLRAELQSGNPDGTQIQQILEEVVDAVKVAADSAETDVQVRLRSLIDALHGFSQQLGGSSKQANAQNQQAPMTSTVGGESTTSGTGASALETNNDDDLSNRNGGTISTVSGNSAVGTDDHTGSEGAQPPSGGSDRVAGVGTGSRGDDYSAGSGTQRSGVSGGSTSSGSSDTDTGTSGGRSQY